MSLHGRPTAAELVAAVAEFLESEVREATSGAVNAHLNFKARVAANALRIVERELLESGESDVRAALADLGFPDEATLAAAIRRGDFDTRTGEVIPALRALVRHRLASAHPGYDTEEEPRS